MATILNHVQCGMDGRHPQGQAPDAVAFAFDMTRLHWWQEGYPRCAECLQEPWIEGDPLTRVLYLFPQAAHEEPRFRAYDDGGGGAYVQCRNCGSDATHFEPDTGWTCGNCGASDADE